MFDDQLVTPLNSKQIVGQKIVLYGPKFSLSELSKKVRIHFNKNAQKDLEDIINLIGSGGDLAPYYRADIDKFSDQLLARHGVMHLHLDGKDSNCILYLLQYEMHVVFLTIDTHVHLEDIPPAKKFPAGYHEHAKKQVLKALEEAEQEKEKTAVKEREKEREYSEELNCSLDKLRASFRERMRSTVSS
jgi:hypothetical protein